MFTEPTRLRTEGCTSSMWIHRHLKTKHSRSEGRRWMLEKKLKQISRNAWWDEPHRYTTVVNPQYPAFTNTNGTMWPIFTYTHQNLSLIRPQNGFNPRVRITHVCNFRSIRYWFFFFFSFCCCFSRSAKLAFHYLIHPVLAKRNFTMDIRSPSQLTFSLPPPQWINQQKTTTKMSLPNRSPHPSRSTIPLLLPHPPPTPPLPPSPKQCKPIIIYVENRCSSHVPSRSRACPRRIRCHWIDAITSQTKR